MTMERVRFALGLGSFVVLEHMNAGRFHPVDYLRYSQRRLKITVKIATA